MQRWRLWLHCILPAGQVMYPILLLIHRLIKLYMHTALPVQKSMERMTRAHENII